jgi:hypothetical protein
MFGVGELGNVLTHFFIIVPLIPCSLYYKHYQIPTFFIIAIAIFSSMYHVCSMGVPYACDISHETQRWDHYVSEFAIPMAACILALYLGETTEELVRNRDTLILGWFVVHSLLHALNAATWLSLWAGAIFGIFNYIVVRKKLYPPLRLIFVSLGIVGIGCFYVDDDKIYDVLHSLWHAFIFTALGALMLSIAWVYVDYRPVPFSRVVTEKVSNVRFWFREKKK